MTHAPYKPSDFKAIGLMATTPLLIEVNKDSKFKDFKSLLAYICANPGKLTVGHSGIGTTNYMGLLAMEEASKCQVTAVPYKGSGPALVDLLGGQIDAVVDQLSSSSGMIHSGKLRALAVLTAKRVSALPDIPTVAESGIKGIDASTDTGLLVPVKTPDAIVQRLNKAIQEASNSPRVQKAMQSIGSAAITSTPDHFMSMIKEEDVFAGKLSAEGKLKR
jgi:tripartite-type tricarboxylate transporter receptor subunit TctC